MTKLIDNMKRILVIMLVVGLASAGIAQQRPISSTYLYNGMIINPAYAGSNNVFSATLTHRDQWVNIDGAPVTQSLTIQNSFLDNRIGAGITILRDQIGVHDELAISASYAYKIHFASGILSMGLSGGLENRKSDFSQLNIKDQNDFLLTGQINRMRPNFGTGIYYANNKIFLGASMPQILRPNIYNVDEIASLARADRFYYINGGAAIPISQHVIFNPSFLLRIQDRSPAGFDLTAQFIFDEVIYAGVSYRSQDSFVAIAQMILNDNFRIGYAYDTVTSDLSNYSPGSHEIMLNYRIKIRNAKKNPLCPVYY
jgi:type IX secretion system PorP/SprF family membrane protein